MELPPPPALREVDPVILADIEEAARKFMGSVEKHREKIPQLWFSMVGQFLPGSFYEYTVKSENDSLIKETREEETKIRMGLKLVLAPPLSPS